MKIAIILNGYIRTWEKCKQSFLDTFGHLDADIYISTYDMKYGFAPYIQQLTNYYDDEPISRKQIMDMMGGVKVQQLIVDNSAEFMKIIENHSLDDATETYKIKIDYHNIHLFLAQFLKLREAFNSIHEHEVIMNIKYDQIIKTRMDLVYNNFVPFVEGKQMLIDSGNVFPNDCFFMANRDIMFEVAKFVVGEFFQPKYATSGSWPPHSILQSAFIDLGLRVTPIPLIKHVERMNLQQKY